jgi:hypothetical protein
MAEFEQFLSGVVRLAARMRLPNLHEPGVPSEGPSDMRGPADSSELKSESDQSRPGPSLGPDPETYRRLASGATLHEGLPHAVRAFLSVLAFPFARTAGEGLARVEEVVRRAPPPRPTLRGGVGGGGSIETSGGDGTGGG